MTRTAEATPGERRAFEELCMAALDRYFGQRKRPLFNGRRVTSLGLRGRYPDTELVASFDSGQPGSAPDR